MKGYWMRVDCSNISDEVDTMIYQLGRVETCLGYYDWEQSEKVKSMLRMERERLKSRIRRKVRSNRELVVVFGQ